MIRAVVTGLWPLARDIVWIELQAADQQLLPGASPGAHIDLHLPNGLVRQYSLTNAQGETKQSNYQIAVALDASSRGGSTWIHDKLRTGASLIISEPRNLFPMAAGVGSRILFIGAGIGITPIYAMVNAAQQNGMDWHLMACARSASRMAFQEELNSLNPQRVKFHFDITHGSVLDLEGLLSESVWDTVYACGPSGMLDAIEKATAHWPVGSVRMERFKAAVQDRSINTGFQLLLAQSQKTIDVRADESALEAMERMGIDHPYACREGLCGTCEVRVIEGLADHRDTVLSEHERQAGLRFIPCVSRCSSPQLVIEL